MTSTSHAADFFIDEVVTYDGAGCFPGNLNDVTTVLKAELNNDGRTGNRYTDSAAWPQDFTESCNSVNGGGFDNLYSDANGLSIFAGHGNSNPTNGPALLFGTPHSSRCSANLYSEVRLGQMSGAQAAYAMYAASCVMRLDKVPTHILKQWLRQQLGFHNSPAIADEQLALFYLSTENNSNVTAWLDELEDKPGLFTGSNSPIVVSKGTSDSEALGTHNGFRFRYGNYFWYPLVGGPACAMNQGAYWWYYTYINNGGC